MKRNETLRQIRPSVSGKFWQSIHLTRHERPLIETQHLPRDMVDGVPIHEPCPDRFRLILRSSESRSTSSIARTNGPTCDGSTSLALSPSVRISRVVGKSLANDRGFKGHRLRGVKVAFLILHWR
jgi:hypothetical protein